MKQQRLIYFSWLLFKKRFPTRIGFEPTHSEYNGLATHHLNHSSRLFKFALSSSLNRLDLSRDTHTAHFLLFMPLLSWHQFHWAPRPQAWVEVCDNNKTFKFSFEKRTRVCLNWRYVVYLSLPYRALYTIYPQYPGYQTIWEQFIIFVTQKSNYIHN